MFKTIISIAAIIGIIAGGLFIKKYFDDQKIAAQIQEAARQDKIQSDIKNAALRLNDAVQDFYMKNGSYQAMMNAEDDLADAYARSDNAAIIQSDIESLRSHKISHDAMARKAD